MAKSSVGTLLSGRAASSSSCHSRTPATDAFRLKKNLSLMGPPGSGKGFYGRLLASAWNAPLYSASKVLRNRTDVRHLLHSGKLVDCRTVSAALLEFLRKEHDITQRGGYLLDGFPRTLLQIQLMEREWPTEYQVNGVILLDIPDRVCEEKMLGRRLCRVCGLEPNVAHVRFDKFDLPPTLPVDCSADCVAGVEQPWWERRTDDTVPILRGRLRAYREEHEAPIVAHYEKQDNEVLRLTPYRGYPDFPWIQRLAEEWLLEQRQKRQP